MAVSERYPELKSNQNFLALQSQLEGTENCIAVARRDFIAAVERYNTEIRTFRPHLAQADVQRHADPRELRGDGRERRAGAASAVSMTRRFPLLLALLLWAGSPSRSRPSCRR